LADGQREEGVGRVSRERETLLHRMKPALWRGMRRRHDANASSGGVDWGRGVYRNWEECAYAWARWGRSERRSNCAEAAPDPHRNRTGSQRGVAVERSVRSAV
jgi:hypothetical protein